MRLLLLGGLIGPLCFATAVVVGAALRPDYDHTMQVMSALGATGSANALLMNGLGFLPTGLLIMGLALGLLRFVPRSILAIVAGLALGIFGAGVVGAGVYSCDPGCIGIGTSRDAYLHIVASVIAFSAGILACFAWAGAFRSHPAWRPLSNFSFGMGLVSAGLLWSFQSTAGTHDFPGIWQRLFIGSLFFWCSAIGVYAFRVSAPHSLVEPGSSSD